MESETQNMGRGRPRTATDHDLLEVLRSGEKPAYPAAYFAEEFDVTDQTARNWLNGLVERNPEVKAEEYANQKLYYSSLTYGPAADREDQPVEDRHIADLVDWATNRFVGLRTAPWTAVHPNDGPATGGDIVQLRVEGTPESGWRTVLSTRLWENRRDKLEWGETTTDETQALISGVLYERPTTPIEHIDYPDDYELEQKIGIKELTDDEGDETGAFVAYGTKNYLIRPCDAAVFLSDPSVDWICPEGYGAGTVPETGIDQDLIEEVEGRRREELKNADEEDLPGDIV